MSKDIEILVVEENLPQSEHLKHILEQHDHPVSVAHNGKLALAAVRARPPQIVISAVLLPEMSGYELCRQIKTDEQLKDIPVILLTSISDPADIIRGMECGADNFVIKPYDEKLLRSRIEYLVLNRQLRVGAGTQTGLEIVLGGQKYFITSERQQMVDLLISTYETAVQKTTKLLRIEQELTMLNNRLEEKVAERTAALVKEISEHQATVKELAESEDRYRRLVELSPETIAVHREGRFAYVNAAGVKLFGAASPEELIGRPILDVIHPDYREVVSSRAQQNLEGEQTPLQELKAIRLDGQVIDIETAGIPITFEDQPAIELVSRDITKRKQAEEALRESEQRYRLLSEGILHQVWAAQPDGKTDYVNERMVAYFGCSPEQLLGDGWQATVHPDDLPVSLEKWTESLQTGEPYEVEYRLRRADGEYCWHAGRATAGRDSEGRILKWFGTNTDINNQKLTEEALRLNELRLQQSQKMEAIGTLAGGVAHDFNNLLTVILGNTNLALRQLPPTNQAHLRLVEIERAGNRATMLTRQLLAFSRRQHLERHTINLNDTVRELVKFLRRIIGEDVEVNVKTAPDLSAVFADPAQLEQMLMNLCVNARDAMPGGGTLTIETSNIELDESYQRQYPYVKPGKYAQIKVSDTGSGFDKETQARIFEPFFTTKAVGKGTGLGLSMVYGIVKQHDGHIHVYSELEQGTTFTVYLPVDEKAVEKEKQKQPLPLLGGTETILVAEDEEALRKLSKDVLESLGYTVLLAKNGEEAIEMYIANRERIDLLLFDVVMPRMSGSEAFEQIHGMGSEIPALFMTGYSSETVQSRFVRQHKLIEEFGAGVIQKPYSLDGLGRRVREALDKKRAE